MGWFEDLVDATQDAIDEAIDVALSGELPPFGAGVRATEDPERIAPGGPDDPVGQMITEAFALITGQDPSELRPERIRGLAQENQEEISRYVQNRIETDRVVRSEIVQAVQESQQMPVDYSDWISIAFEVAKSKGATFETTQSQIQRGNAPTSEAITLFAEIWNDRKEDIRVSREAARRIARQEINV